MYKKITYKDMKTLRRLTSPLVTQGDMARHLGCSTRKIERYENGEADLSHEDFSKYWALCHKRVKNDESFLGELKTKLLWMFKLG